MAISGLTLIPGPDADGNPWRMGLFHALYFVSFMSTTIGFGEIPYEFTDGQRLWVMFCIYATVVVWIYAIGTLIALLQDKTFHRPSPNAASRAHSTAARTVLSGLRLRRDRQRTGPRPDRASSTCGGHRYRRTNVSTCCKIENLRAVCSRPCARTPRRPEHLLEAGLKHPLCAGVVALTNVNEINLQIAITAKCCIRRSR